LRAAGCVFAAEEAELLTTEAAGDGRRLEAMLRRRESGEPLEYVLGWAELAGVRVRVEPGVFVPRDRSTPLVEEALALLRRSEAERPLVVDLCCGSGAIGAAIASAAGAIELHACDCDATAVALATRNLERFEARVHRGDLLDALPAELRGRVDLIAANAPYVPSGEIGLMPRDARLYEPPWALDGGADGLDPLRRIAASAPGWLAPGGSVIVEAASDGSEAAAATLGAAGLQAHATRSEEHEVAVLVGVATERPL
jgi:release factor glutamine methyltransferase